jgi:hypothetical protein
MATFDVSGFPIVVSHWAKDVDIAEINDYFDQLDVVIDRAVAQKQRYVSISVGGSNLSAALRKVVAERSSKIPPERAVYNVASYVVLESAILRGTLTALKWISSNMENVYPVATVEEGLRRGRAALLDSPRPDEKSA